MCFVGCPSQLKYRISLLQRNVFPLAGNPTRMMTSFCLRTLDRLGGTVGVAALLPGEESIDRSERSGDPMSKSTNFSSNVPKAQRTAISSSGSADISRSLNLTRPSRALPSSLCSSFSRSSSTVTRSTAASPCSGASFWRSSGTDLEFFSEPLERDGNEG